MGKMHKFLIATLKIVGFLDGDISKKVCIKLVELLIPLLQEEQEYGSYCKRDKYCKDMVSLSFEVLHNASRRKQHVVLLVPLKIRLKLDKRPWFSASG